MEHVVAALVGSLVALLVVAAFLHVAARFLTKRPRFSHAILTALVGGVLAGAVLVAIPWPWIGRLAAVVVWLAVAAGFYRIGLLRALALGVVAWLLFVLVQWLIELAVRALAAGT